MAPNPYAKYAPQADAPPPTNPYARYAGPTIGPGPDRGQRVLDYVDNLVRQAAQGATFGLADEATAYLNTLPTKLGPRESMLGGPIEGPGPGPTYDQALKAARDQDKVFISENPVAGTLAQVTGGVMTLPFLPGVAAVKGGTWLGNTARGALTGAGFGGASGFGHGEGGLENRLRSAGIGATGGAVVGGALPSLANTAGFLGRAAKESRAGQWVGENIVAPALEKTAGVVEALAPKIQPKSLSAAAADGSAGMPVSGAATSVAELLRRKADAARDVSTRGAQERLAREFERYALDPQTVARELENMPGAMLANAGPTGTLDRVARTMHDMPGQAQSIIRAAVKNQREGAPERIVGAFEGNQPPPQLYDAQRFLAANVKQTGSDLYDPLRAAGLNVSDDMRRLLDVPAIREVYDFLVADAAKHGKTLTPFDLMHKLKRQLNQNTESAFASGKPVNKDTVRETGDDWERALYLANPKVQVADQNYALAKQLPDLLEQGGQFLRTGSGEAATGVSPAALADKLPKLDDTGRLVFGVGATNAVRDKALQGPGPTVRLAGAIDEGRILQEKLAQIYGPERAKAIIEASKNERRFLENRATMVGGSGSSANIAHLIDDGLQVPTTTLAPSTPGVVMSLVKGAVDMARKQTTGNEPVRTEIARLLMESNPTGNLKNLDVVEAIMRQRLAAQLRNARMGAAGASAGGGELGGAF